MNLGQKVLLGKRQFNYTEQGLVSEERVYDDQDALRYTLYTSYNRNGKPTKKAIQ
ncbi:MAG: hypothetical protein QRY74_05450 [Chlamydia sp.]